MDITQVKLEMSNSKIHAHLCNAINYLSDADLLAESSLNYSVKDIAVLLDIIKNISAIGCNFPRINSEANK